MHEQDNNSRSIRDKGGDVMISTRKKWKAICATGALFLFFVSMQQALYAEEAQAQDNASVPSNIGFMKNPPKELSEKFPMCDDFLKVKWLNKKQMVGYSSYDIIDLTTKKRARITALVSLGMYPGYEWDVQEYQRTGKLDELFSFVRAGRVLRGHGLLSIRNGKEALTFWSYRDGASISGRHGSLCIPYPDGQRMWIELKSVGQSMSGKKLEQSYELFKRSFPDVGMNNFRRFRVLDIHPDAHDYLGYGIKPGMVLPKINVLGMVLYFQGHYYKLERSERVMPEGVVRIYRFPPTSRSCENKWDKEAFDPVPEILTTDGKDYFIGNQCNLTKLTEEAK